MQSDATPRPNEPNLQVGLTFVELMFAVAVGDTAAQVAKVTQFESQMSGTTLENYWQLSPAISHLLLVLIIIATSWVGWSHSSVTRKYMSELKEAFSDKFPWLISFPFLMLLIDVFLVVCYFVLSEAVELPDQKTSKFTPSATPEIGWVLLILATYVVWNFVSCFHARWVENQPFLGNRRGWRILAAMGSMLIPVFAYCTNASPSSTKGILMIDGALLLAILLFRLRIVDSDSHLAISGILRAILFFMGAFALIYFAL